MLRDILFPCCFVGLTAVERLHEADVQSCLFTLKLVVKRKE